MFSWNQCLRITAVVLHRITNSYGSPTDEPRVKAFIEGNDLEQDYTSGVSVSNFYAFGHDAIDPGALWQEILIETGADIPLPGDFTLDNLAHWLVAHVALKIFNA